MELETLVIGKGLIGAAAAKYLSQSSPRVALVGPDEPVEPVDVERAIVFASHYDSGRVQRQIGRNETMTWLNLRAIENYPRLQRQSGIRFHEGEGCLYVNPLGRDRYLDEAPARAKRYGVEVEFFDGGSALKDAFPAFDFPQTSRGMHERSPSGHIDPRRLIQSQLVALERNGGTVVRDLVSRLARDGNWFQAATRAGETLRAKRVLVATGAFTNISSLLPRKLALIMKSETVILARVGSKESERLRDLPSLLYELDVAELEGIYATPPLRYPDGNTYLKMGCNLPEDIFFGDDLDAIQNWFRNGDSDGHIDKIQRVLTDVLPGITLEDCASKRCILTRTRRHENPYVGAIDDGLFVAIGNGWSAMCSDAVGGAAAHLMLAGELPEGLDSEELAPVFAD